ncbi:DUF6542 domain-containing protein [Streptomyces turgidiscabies]|uniref:DUF6542 domain-containing protein n=2 Tax=Streptomyces TaxID=1883 RepID=UPI0005C80F26|nr:MULTISPECIES: DUF6542 domain-containing protein [Streptomyces]GAQ69972.1 hypothetical protein T45_01704 [Streptomyces turgidiscabies]
MEQHRIRHRPPNSGPARPGRGASAAPRGGRAGGQAAAGSRRPPAGVRRSSPPVVQALRRMPNPRLTGLGGGLFCAAVMFALGCLDQLLFGSSLTVYGVLFLPVCALTAAWIRGADLVIAPVVVPIAFTVGLLPVADGDGGLFSHLMGIVTALATEAGWLYGGTLVAGVIATVRKIRLMNRRPGRTRTPV